jgi:hypothetical protein
VTSVYGSWKVVASLSSSLDPQPHFALQTVPVIGATDRIKPHPSSPGLRYCRHSTAKKAASAPAAGEYPPGGL